MQPNLREWLRPYAELTGSVVPVNPRKKLDRVRKAAGLARWPQNGLRHSFASYRLAATHDAPRVASELGHTSPKMFYSTYPRACLARGRGEVLEAEQGGGIIITVVGKAFLDIGHAPKDGSNRRKRLSDYAVWKVHPMMKLQ